MQTMLSPRIMSLVEALPVGTLFFDHQGEVHFANSRAMELLGLGLTDLMERRLQHALSNPDLLTLVDQIRSGVSPRAMTEIELEGRPLNIRGFSLEDEQELEGLHLLLVEDLTPFRDINQVKARFVSDLLHKVRTPLTTVRTLHELLVDELSDRIDPDILEFLRMSRSEVDRLTSLIADLRDLLLIESGLMEQAVKPTVLLSSDLLRNALDSFPERAKAALLKADRANIGQPVQIRGDATLLKRAIGNVLSNALHYTPEGGRVEIQSDTDQPGWLALTIRDSGIGMAREDLDRAFDKFFRVDNQINQSLIGNGLGLFVARHFLELHGGSLGCTSEPDQGSQFEIRIPTLTSAGGS